MEFLDNRTITDQTAVLAQYLRNDNLHAQKNNPSSKLYKVLQGLAYEFLRERDLINEIYQEYDPNNTTKLLEEWEAFVGIPDSCFSNTGTIDQRRKNILLKLVGSNATTKQQFEKIATILGFNITVSSGADIGNVLPLTLPFILQDQGEAPFTIIVSLNSSLESNLLPLTLPFTLSSGGAEILRCFLEKLKPANTKLIYRYV
jgi:uncharacterized protein YmfQ (DUF2313 family)